MNSFIAWIDSIDKSLFLFLNNLHSEVFDFLMYWITKQETWYPFYLVVIIWVFWKFKAKGFIILLMITITIIITDQVTSAFMKPFFERLRPCHNPSINNLVHVVSGCGGQFGFASSHASNSFGLAMVLYILFKDLFKYAGWIFVWAGIVAYSRIYVGVHYPGDIIVGALIGIASGYLVTFIFGYTSETIDKLIKK